MHNHGNAQIHLSFITQNGPVRMSSPVSTGILKFCGRWAASALGAPPVRCCSDIVAPRFPTLCKRCASFRATDHQQLLGLIRSSKGHGVSKLPNDNSEKGLTKNGKRVPDHLGGQTTHLKHKETEKAEGCTKEQGRILIRRGPGHKGGTHREEGITLWSIVLICSRQKRRGSSTDTFEKPRSGLQTK